MELVCAFLFIIVSCADAHPYGHGGKQSDTTKDPASTTASIAGAVSVAGAPFVNPGIAGYSGSFSKSSSFSSSSASSSSSSSSSSFNINGAGIPLTGSNDIFVAGIGCQTGCQNSKGIPTGLQGTSISGTQNVSHSNSFSTSAAGSQSESIEFNGNPAQSCLGGNCKLQTSPCTGSACVKALQSENQVSNNDKKDIPVVATGELGKVPQNSNDDSTNKNKLTPGKCQYGNCGIQNSISTTASSSVSSIPESNTLNYRPTKCNTPDCNNSHSRPFAFYSTSSPISQVPSMYFTLPKETPKECNHANCPKSPETNISNLERFPPIYPPPSFTTYPTSQSDNKTPNCDSGSCPNSPKPGPSNSNNLQTNVLTSVNYEKDRKKCSTANCESSQIKKSQTSKPPESGIPDFVPLDTINPSKCTSGKCANSTIDTVYSDEKNPTYFHSASPISTPVGIGHANCGGPNCNVNGYSAPHHSPLPTLTNVPNHSHLNLPQLNKPLPVGSSPNCGSPNCYGNPTAPVLSSVSTSPPYGLSKPIMVPVQKLPVYSGGFGGPAGFLKPNDYTIQSPNAFVQHKPPAIQLSTQHPTVSNVPTSQIPTNIPSSNYPNSPPTGTNYADHLSPCTSSNCGASPSGSPQYGHGNIPTHIGPNVPSKGSPTYGQGSIATNIVSNMPTIGFTESPQYSQGSIPINIASNVPSAGTVPQYGQGNNPTHLTSNVPIGSVGSPQYDHGSIATSVASNVPVVGSAGSPHYGQGSLPTHVSPNLPLVSTVAVSNSIPYSGGFGGPPGLLKPYDNGKHGATSLAGTDDKHLKVHSNTGSYGTDNFSQNYKNLKNGADTSGSSAVHTGAISGAVSGVFNNGFDKLGAHGKESHINECNKCGVKENVGLGFIKNAGDLFGFNGEINGVGSLAKSIAGSLNGASTGSLSGGSSGSLSAASAGSYSGANAGSLSGAGAKLLSGASAGSFGLGGSFSTSVASAGAVTKGGYGRK